MAHAGIADRVEQIQLLHTAGSCIKNGSLYGVGLDKSRFQLVLYYKYGKVAMQSFSGAPGKPDIAGTDIVSVLRAHGEGKGWKPLRLEENRDPALFYWYRTDHRVLAEFSSRTSRLSLRPSNVMELSMLAGPSFHGLPHERSPWPRVQTAPKFSDLLARLPRVSPGLISPSGETVFLASTFPLITQTPVLVAFLPNLLQSTQTQL